MENQLVFLAASDVAKILDTSVSYVRTLERSGKLKAIRVGKQRVRLFTRASVERFMAEPKRPRGRPRGTRSQADRHDSETLN